MENELERTQSEQTKNDETVVSETQIQTEQQFVHYEEETNLKRLPLAILSGLGASIIGAVIWGCSNCFNRLSNRLYGDRSWFFSWICN